LTTATYVDRGGVSGNRHLRAPPSAGVTTGSPLLLTTVQRSGATTVKACGALRSGWSKQAHANRASSGSNVVQKYTSLSDGSTDRWARVPAAVSGCTDSTTSTLSAARSLSWIRPAEIWSPPIATPLSVAETTSRAASTKVAAPGSRHEKRTVETARKSVPSSMPVRSTWMS
jgi:hypothetical protein